MANSNNSAAYDFSAFQATRSAAPNLNPNAKPDLRVVKPKRKTAQELKQEAKIGRKEAFLVCLATIFCFTVLGINIYGQVQKNALSHEIASYQSELKIAQSENTRLQMMLNSYISIDKIEDYAAENLGMIKMTKNHMSHVDVSAARLQAQEDSNDDSKSNN